MMYVKTIKLEEATGALKEEYEKAIRRAGKIFNIVKLSSLSPQILKASMDFYVSLMHRDFVLSRATKEMIAVVVSKVNKCHY